MANLSTSTLDFVYRQGYKDNLLIGISTLIADIELLEDEERYFELSLARNSLTELVNKYKTYYGELSITYKFPNIYDYVV